MNLRLLSLLFFCIPFALIAQQSIGLDEVVQQAVQNNYTLKIAKNTIEVAALKTTVGQAGFLPSLDFSAGYNYSNSISKTTFYGGFPDQSNRAAASQNYNAGINLNYTLFDGLKPVYQLKKSKIELGLSSAQYHNELQKAVYNVVQSYFSLAKSMEDYRIATEKYQLTKQQGIRIDIQRKYGQGNESERLNLQSTALADSAQLLRINLTIRRAIRQLNRLIGTEYLNEDVQLKIETDVDLSLNFDNILDAALQNNTAIVQATLDIENAKIDLKITHSEWFPKLNTTISYGYNGNQNDVGILKSNDAVGPSVNIGLRYSIYNGGALKRTEKQQKLNIKGRELRLAMLRYETEQNVKDAFAMHENNISLVAIETSNASISKINFDRVRTSYELGQASYFDYQQAAFNYIQSQKK